MKRANEIYKSQLDELNLIYANLDDSNLLEICKICGLNPTKEAKIAALKRLVNLKNEGLEAEFKRLNFSQERQRELKSKVYDFVAEFYHKRHERLLDEFEKNGAFSEFETAVLRLTHAVGVELTRLHKKWNEAVVEGSVEWFKHNFETSQKAQEFITSKGLFLQNGDKSRGERSYCVVKGYENGTPKLVAYAAAFDCAGLKAAFESGISRLKNLAKTQEERDYANYFEAVKEAFLLRELDGLIPAWQAAERAWMKVTSPLQVAHPLEYYEDAFTNAVALEWDARLSSGAKTQDFAAQMGVVFNQICQKLGVTGSVAEASNSNLTKTQLYICNPVLFYGAEFDGLFSAQVVPNDEMISKECGKKIFAFVDYVYQNALLKPKMRLAGEVFEEWFLEFCEGVLQDEAKWKKVYEISTIGHEYGHILFVDDDTERVMNVGGEFKLVEEFKATSGGLVKFIYELQSQNGELKEAVLSELIRRAVGLVSWQKVSEVQAYYCEGLIHLCLLTKSGVVRFEGLKVFVDFSRFEAFCELFLQTYYDLALHYAKKANSSEFLARFVTKNEGIFLPKEAAVAEFVKCYFARYEEIANEVI